MKTKLEMAHEWAMQAIDTGYVCETGTLVIEAWQYADAMQAEADKREKEEAAQRRKEIREMLNAPNTFVEREGQHFDDMEWQPDWSQAPDWANFLVRSFKGTAYWHSSEPRPSGAGWVDGGHCDLAHLDCYHSAGDWRNSLRKRPE